LEITSYLWQSERCAPVPEFCGAIEYQRKGKETATVATLHRFVRNEGDAWHHTLDVLGRYFERVLSEFPADPAELTVPRGGLVQLASEPRPSCGVMAVKRR
jgi:maltose alpha-D-glucosyltransferase/alpha-amylase